jgi:predicted RNA-binding protein with PUA-like domain
VRNYQARNNLRSMRKGDLVFFYHSGEEKQIVGLARVSREPYPDPTADEGDWVCVDLIPVKNLTKSVTLAAIKADSHVKDIPMVKNSRLSVTPLAKPQFERLLVVAETKL